MPIITLTTDFGMRDGYVGAVKGVISRLAPEAAIVDIAHDVPRGDIAHAAWVVATSTPEFPHGTIHVVVVDPGVGGARAGVIVRVNVPGSSPSRGGTQMYVGPDNGVFAYLDVDRAWAINTSSLDTISATFHGRDVFAPVAAAIAKQRIRDLYGPVVTLAGTLPWSPTDSVVVHVDHFGNLITNARNTYGDKALRIAGRDIPIVRTYEDVAPGELLAYVGSAGTLEIAVRDGRADESLRVGRGVSVSTAAEGPYR